MRRDKMIIYETKIEPKEIKKFINKKCDLCKSITTDIWKWHGWPKEGYGSAQTELTMEWGSFDPDGGGCGKRIEIDICPKCFKEKLVPWLEEQGCEIREEKWER